MHMAGRLAGIQLVEDRTPYVVLPSVAVRQSWFLWCETSHYNKAGSAPRGTRARRNPDSEQKGGIQAGNVRVNNGDVTSMCMSNRPERWLSLLQLVQNERGGPPRAVCVHLVRVLADLCTTTSQRYSTCNGEKNVRVGVEGAQAHTPFNDDTMHVGLWTETHTCTPYQATRRPMHKHGIYHSNAHNTHR